MLYMEHQDGTLTQVSVAQYSRKFRDEVHFMNPGDGWQRFAEELCVITILDCLLARKAVPQFGLDVADWWKMRDFLPGVLQPFMHSKMMLPYSNEVRHQLRFAYETAYKRVRDLFPWLEQNPVQLT